MEGPDILGWTIAAIIAMVGLLVLAGTSATTSPYIIGELASSASSINSGFATAVQLLGIVSLASIIAWLLKSL